MLDELTSFLDGKRVLLLGFGREGRESLIFLQEHAPNTRIGIADRHNLENVSDDIAVHAGDNYLDALTDYDLILRSPGVPLTREIWKKYGDRISSQTELFLRYAPGTVIGITGTKGKSTTASLLAHIFTKAKRECHLIGNIGVPPLSVLGHLHRESISVFELSSHQLFHAKASPEIALLLNIYPEHLDYYESFEAYREAKLNIAQFQTESGSFFYNEAQFPSLDPEIFPGKISPFDPADRDASVFMSEGRVFIRQESDLQELYTLSGEGRLSGEHNGENIVAATLIARRFNISPECIQEALATFNPLPHRIEKVRGIKGINFYDDSASTIPEATISAMNAVPDLGSIIIGGMDRGIDYSKLVHRIVQHGHLNVMLLPDTGSRILKLLTAHPEFNNTITSLNPVTDLREAICRAVSLNDTCLFSPAAASYHAFRDYAHRGESFQKLVREITDPGALKP